MEDEYGNETVILTLAVDIPVLTLDNIGVDGVRRETENALKERYPDWKFEVTHTEVL